MSAGQSSTTNAIVNIFEATMKNILLSLLFVSIPAFGHGFDTWQTEYYDKVRFAFQVNDDCPASDRSVYEERLYQELTKNGLEVEEFDPSKTALIVSLDCFPDGNVGGLNFYMSTSLAWPQGDGFPFLDLVYYYGHREDIDAIESDLYRMMGVGIQRYLQRSVSTSAE